MSLFVNFNILDDINAPILRNSEYFENTGMHDIFGLICCKLYRKLMVEKTLFFLFILIFLFHYFSPIKQITERCHFVQTYKEPRTEAVEFLRDNYPDARIGIANELRLHPNDIAKIKNPQIFEISKISVYDSLSAIDYVISSDNYGGKNHDVVQQLNTKFPPKAILKTFGSGVVSLDIYSVEPKVNIYKVDLAVDPALVKNVYDVKQDEIWPTITNRKVNFCWNGQIKSKMLKFKEGHYELKIYAHGSVCAKQWPLLEFTMASFANGKILEMNNRYIQEINSDKDKWYIFSFNVKEDSIIFLKLGFINDACTKTEDRNVYISNIKVE
jgi:hypothetical protein